MKILFYCFFSLIVISVVSAQPSCLTFADKNCDQEVNISEVTEYIKIWYKCSSCVQDLGDAMNAYFEIYDVCTPVPGCISSGSFCDGNLPYTCMENPENGCLERQNLTECVEECINGVCVDSFEDCQPDTYYIDYESGSDNNNGSCTYSAWKHAPGMKGFSGIYIHQEGDRFVFKGGVIWPQECFTFSILSSGGEDNPDTYTADKMWYKGNEYSYPVFDGGGNMADNTGIVKGTAVHNIIIDSIKIQNVGQPGITNHGRAILLTDIINWKISNSVIEAYSNHCMVVNRGGRFPLLYNLTIFNNDISNCNNFIEFGGQREEFHDIFIYNNTFRDPHSQLVNGDHTDGIHFHPGVTKFKNVKIFNNRFSGDWGASDLVTNGTAQIFLENSPEDVEIYNNIFGFENNEAINLDYILNEAISLNGIKNVKVYSNTLYYPEEINIRPNSGFKAFVLMTEECENVDIKNNIISNSRWGIFEYRKLGYHADSFSSDFNIYDVGEAVYVETNPVKKFDLTEFQATGNGTNSIIAKPDFYKTTFPFNLHLRSGSPAIDNGTELGEFDFDFDGTQRPKGTAWDIGAYEYTPTTQTSTCEADTVNGKTCYYVDNALATNGDGTSWEKSWNSFANIVWTSINQGDYIYISGGSINRTYQETLTIGGSGTVGNPITIRPGLDTGHDGLIIITNPSTESNTYGINFNGHDHVTLNGKKDTEEVPSTPYENKDYAKIMVTGTQSHGINGAEGTGLKVLYLYVYRVGRGTGANGIHFADCDGFEISYCDLDGAFHDGIKHGSFSGYGRQKIHHNWIHGLRDDLLAGGGGIDVYENVIGPHGDYGVTSGYHSDGIQSYSGYVRVWNNVFHEDYDTGDTSSMLFLSSPWQSGFGHLRVWNNLFFCSGDSYDKGKWFGINVHPGAGVGQEDVDDVVIANNAFVDVGWVAVQVSTHNDLAAVFTNFYIMNNIVYNSKASGSSFVMGIFNVDIAASDVLFDYNSVRPGVRGRNGFGPDDFVGENNNQDTDPNFVNYSPGDGLLNDLHLAEGSFGIDNGTNLSSYVGTMPGIDKDKDGNQRPDGEPWDIGAYEYTP